jgi:hypothetical protein
MINDIHRQTIEIQRQHDLIWNNDIVRAQRMLFNDLERREHHAIEHFRQIGASFHSFNRSHELGHLQFNNELHRLRYFYGKYVESLDNVRLKKSLISAIEELLSTLKRGLSHYYHLIQILREQKRLQHKIKSLHRPIEIIPESLRPIKLAA